MCPSVLSTRSAARHASTTQSATAPRTLILLSPAHTHHTLSLHICTLSVRKDGTLRAVSGPGTKPPVLFRRRRDGGNRPPFDRRSEGKLRDQSWEKEARVPMFIKGRCWFTDKGDREGNKGQRWIRNKKPCSQKSCSERTGGDQCVGKPGETVLTCCVSLGHFLREVLLFSEEQGSNRFEGQLVHGPPLYQAFSRSRQLGTVLLHICSSRGSFRNSPPRSWRRRCYSGMCLLVCWGDGVSMLHVWMFVSS